MNVCGVEIVESRVVLIVIATLACLLLLAFTSIAVWADRRYQRSDARYREDLHESWRAPEEREEEAQE